MVKCKTITWIGFLADPGKGNKNTEMIKNGMNRLNILNLKISLLGIIGILLIEGLGISFNQLPVYNSDTFRRACRQFHIVCHNNQCHAEFLI